MGNGNLERRENPPCDIHELRIDNLEKSQEGMKLTLYGQDGRGGINQAFNDIKVNTESTKETVENKVNDMKKMVYLFIIPADLAILGIAVAAIKYIFFGG